MESQRSAHQISCGCFKWLAPRLSWPAEADEIKPVDPDELSSLVSDAALTEAEMQALWCYIDLASGMDSKLRERAQAQKKALRVSDDFVSVARTPLDCLVNDKEKNLTVRSLLASPSPEVMQVITEVVAEHQAPARLNRKTLIGLKSCVFEHAGDRAFLTKFRAIPGADTLVGKFLDFVHKKPMEISLIAGGVHVTPSSIPWLHDCFREAYTALNIQKPPELYVVADGGLNAFTTGADEPIIVVTAGAVNLLDRLEIIYVLGHELGHVVAGHVKYGMLGDWITGASSTISSLTLGLGAIPINLTILPGLYAWLRRSEFTADRAGLLACQEREAVLRAMLKLTGYPARFYDEMRTRPLLEQVRLYEERLANDTADRLYDLNQVWGQAHPRAMLRVSELLSWMADGSYQEIVEASPAYLKVLAKRVLDDPLMQEVASAACVALTNWAAEHFSVPKSVAGPIVRRMLGEQQSPVDTPLEPVLRVELQVVKASADDIRYNLVFLVNQKGKALKTAIPLPLDAPWDSAPAALREEFITSGKDELTRLLYTCNPNGVRKETQ
ncbi:MAG: M48 family metallopeptidase [Planctomycetota bacterium]